MPRTNRTHRVRDPVLTGRNASCDPVLTGRTNDRQAGLLDHDRDSEQGWGSAIGRLVEAVGPGHPWVACARMDFADQLMSQGGVELAQTHYQTAESCLRVAVAPPPPSY